MRKHVYIASDHAGFELKRELVHFLSSIDYEVTDLGAHELVPSDDYPDFIHPCALRVAQEEGAFGIVLGGSGHGEAMVANRVPGVRAATFYGRGHFNGRYEAGDEYGKDGFDIVRAARLHNDANVLSLGARFVSEEDARAAARIFLQTPFSGAANHERRIKKF